MWWLSLPTNQLTLPVCACYVAKRTRTGPTFLLCSLLMVMRIINWYKWHASFVTAVPWVGGWMDGWMLLCFGDHVGHTLVFIIIRMFSG